MKRLILLIVFAIALIGFQFISNCADSLDTVSQVPTIPARPDTDTIYRIDTVIVMVIDSVTHVDTVFITEHDTCEASRILCSRIACNQQEIVWMFRNHEGVYRLEFVASIERDHPTQTLNLNIDGREFEWSTEKNPEFTIALHLKQNATIRITSDKPSAFGHAIAVCLTRTRL